MNIKDVKIGDILDAYIQGGCTQRVMIISKNEDDNLVFGITTDNQIVEIQPETEIENVITNINSL